MNKTVLVTGSSRGIGKAIAYEFALLNYNVVINCVKNVNKLNDTFKQLKNINNNILAVQADVSNYNQVCNMYDEIENKFGSVDIVINNAGISYVGLFNEMKPDNWKDIMNTNVNSMFNCTYKALPHMISNKSGSIINISSIWGNVGASCEAVYSASKGAVNSFTKALAKELGPCNIRINAISCGIIDTEMNCFLSEDEKKQLTEQIPLMRFGKPKDVAKLAVFLASENSNYLTGQIITLDGAFI